MIPTVKALIIKGSKVLIATRGRNCKHRPGGLTLPGGQVEDNESNEQAIIREVLEETGYMVQIERKLAKKTYPARTPGQHIQTTYFVCTITGGQDNTPNSEIDNVQWTSPADIKDPKIKEITDLAGTYF